MAKIAKKLTDLVGNTPLMELSGYCGKYGLEQNIIAKLEAFNPAGSVKDRVALSMIEDAEARQLLARHDLAARAAGCRRAGQVVLADVCGTGVAVVAPKNIG